MLTLKSCSGRFFVCAVILGIAFSPVASTAAWISCTGATSTPSPPPGGSTNLTWNGPYGLGVGEMPVRIEGYTRAVGVIGVNGYYGPINAATTTTSWTCNSAGGAANVWVHARIIYANALGVQQLPIWSNEMGPV